MTISVNIAEAKARLSELVNASVKGEDVILQRFGVPQARIVPLAETREAELAQIARDRSEAFGMFAEAYRGFDTDVLTMKRDRIDYDENDRWWLGDASS